MTPNAPTFNQIETFLKADGWTEVTGQQGWGSSHRVFVKHPAPGEPLVTHISHSGHKSPGAGRFSEILRDQVQVNKADFWQAISSGKPVDRPVEIEEEVVAPHGWQVLELLGQMHLDPTELEGMSPEEAQGRIDDWRASDGA